MTNVNPLDPLLDQIAAMLEKIKKGALREISDEDLAFIGKHLDVVEKNVEIFKALAEDIAKQTKQTAKLSVITPEEGKTPREKRFLQRARGIRDELISVKKEYERFKYKEKIKKERRAATGKKRKKKFKRLGGEGWLPL